MKSVIRTDEAPAAIGPYSQAVLSGDTLYMSMQIPVEPAAGKITDDTAGGQARQVMRNLEAVLTASGMTWADVVKTTIFLASMDDFQKVNGVYGQYFDSDPPARATIQVAALPLGALVAIEAVARRQVSS